MSNAEICKLLRFRQDDDTVRYEGGKGESPGICDINFYDVDKSDYKFMKGELYTRVKKPTEMRSSERS